MDINGLELKGVSVGGWATSIDVPELKVAVDLGQCLERVVARSVVLITHAHADHLGAIAQHAAQRGLRQLRPATYVVPPGIEDEVQELLAVWRRLDKGSLRANIVPLAPGVPFELRKDLSVRPFRTRHRVISQGYLFQRVRHRLLPELQGLDGSEIGRRRAAGEPVTETAHEAILAVTGDTTLDAVLAQPEVVAVERLILEATFLDSDVSVERARSMGHVHLDEIAEAADLLTCGALVLNHVSPRYSRARAEELLRAKLPASLYERTRLMMA